MQTDVVDETGRVNRPGAGRLRYALVGAVVLLFGAAFALWMYRPGVADAGDQIVIGVIDRFNPGGGEMSRLSPADEMPLVTRWIMNLVYDPFIRYSVDETIAPGEPFKLVLPQQPYADAAGALAECRAKAWGDRFTTFTGRIGLGSGNFFPDSPVPAVLSESTEARQSILNLMRQAHLADGLRPRVANNGIEFDFTVTERIGPDFLLTGLCSLARVAEPDRSDGVRYRGTGPFRFASEGRESNTLVLARNDRHAFFRGPMLAANGAPLDSVLQKQLSLRRLVFRYIESIDNIAGDKERADLFVLGFDPFRRLGRKMPERLGVRLLPNGFHYYAFVNPAINEPQRRAIWTRLIQPARDRVIEKDLMERGAEHFKNDLWFPKSWRYASYVTNASEEPWAALPPAGAPAAAFERPCRVAVYSPGGVGVSSDGRKEPIVARLQEIAAAQGWKDFQVQSIDDTDWKQYDVVLFRREFDPWFGDLGRLLDFEPLTTLLQTNAPVLRSELEGVSNRFVVAGPQDAGFILSVRAAQKSMVDTGFLFPLFTQPVFLYYDKTKLGPVMANYTEGLLGIHKLQTQKAGR